MVDVRVNLLKNRRVLSEKEYLREKEMLSKSVIGLVIVVVIVISFAILNLVLTRKLMRIEQAISASNKELQGYTQASAQQIYLKSRLNLITGFLTDRSIVRETLQKILSTQIAGVYISGVTFVSDSVLGVAYSASDYKALDDLLTYYQDDTGYFTQTVSHGITKSKDGSYQLSLALTIPKGAK